MPGTSPEDGALPDNVDSASVPESLNEAGLPEVLEPSESDRHIQRCPVLPILNFGHFWPPCFLDVFTR